MDMKSLCIAVPLKSAEDVRKTLLDEGKLNKGLKLEKNEEFLYLPIIDDLKEDNVLGYQVLKKDFQEMEKEIKSYKELIEIPDNIRELLPTSYDIIGKVAIIKIPHELVDYEIKIGNAVLDSHKSIETVAVDLGVEGEERVRNLKIVSGEDSTETVHKQYGIELEIDPSKVYFSPRLANEHWRVAQQIMGGKVVIDMFCGIGPFSILIAKNSSPEKVHAIDINENAIDYLKRNIERNKVFRISPYLGDSKEIVPELEPADRIIMNLPHSAYEFLPAALLNIKNRGVIHYYEVVGHDVIDKRFEEIQELVEKEGMRIYLLALSEVHTYSPDSSMFCFDLKVEKEKGSF